MNIDRYRCKYYNVRMLFTTKDICCTIQRLRLLGNLVSFSRYLVLD